MRIISGKYKGRHIEGFDIVGTRPTMDRVKESLFGMIGPKIKGSSVLDLFGGTGSLGFEAISMGASSCTFVDKNMVAIRTMKKTISNIKIEEDIRLLHMDYNKALNEFSKDNQSFDLIFLDPPYDLHIINSILKKIKENNLLNEEGLIICEYETENIDTTLFKLYKEKKYGNKYIKIYQH